MELRWVIREDDAFWIAQRPARDDLICNIQVQDRRPINKQGPIDEEEPTMVKGSSTTFMAAERVPTPPTHSPLRARTPTPTETSTEPQDEPTDEGAEPEQINIYSPEVEALATQTASLHIPTDEPITTQIQTQTRVREEPPYLRINPMTGHVMDVDPQDALPSIEPWGPITQTPLMHLNLPKSLDGNSTSPEEGTPVDCLQQEEEEDHHLAYQGHPREV